MEVGMIDLWTNFLPIANLAFVIVFVIVIYSTATGQGLTNYSVKKILPRLIVTAIGVNVSFYLCAILADLVNIVAVAIPDFIFGPEWRDPVYEMTPVEAAEGVIGTFILVVVMLAFRMVTLVAVLVTVLALAARQILLSLLVIISPLAIVCAVLPATQNLFQKWAKTYVQLLVVYPLFILIYALVGWFQVTGVENLMQTNSILDAGVKAIITMVINAILPVIPVVAIYPLLKMSGGVMGKITGQIEKSPLGTQGALGKFAQGADQRNRQTAIAGNALGGRLNPASWWGAAARRAQNRGRQTDAMNQEAMDASYNAYDANSINRQGRRGRQRSQINQSLQASQANQAAALTNAVNRLEEIDPRINQAELEKEIADATKEGIKQGYREDQGRQRTNELMAQQSAARLLQNQQAQNYATDVNANANLRNRAAAGNAAWQNRVRASAYQAIDEEQKKDEQAAEVLLPRQMQQNGQDYTQNSDVMDVLNDALQSGDTAMVMAASKRINQIGTIKQQRDMAIAVSQNAHLSVAQKGNIAADIATNSDLGKTGTIGGSLRGQIAGGQIASVADLTAGQVGKLGELKDDTMKGLDNDMFNELNRVAGGDMDERAKIQNAIYKLYENNGAMTEKAIAAAANAGYDVPGGPPPVFGPVAPPPPAP